MSLPHWADMVDLMFLNTKPLLLSISPLTLQCCRKYTILTRNVSMKIVNLSTELVLK